MNTSRKSQRKGRFMRKIIKQAVALNLAAVLAFSLAGCGSTEKKKSQSETESGKQEQVNRNQADWAEKAVIYEVNVRQYTAEGTFKAFEEHLQDIKETGVNTLWFMPIYSISQVNKKGTLGSYYSISDYKNVNSEFGTMDDFKEIVTKAHDMGFKIVLDWVANHTGFDHVWITEHPEYYLHDAGGEIVSPLGTDWTDVAQLDYKNNDMREAMIDSMKFWIDDIGIDGFRCDYAQGVSIDFWEQARKELDKIKPIWMVAEDGTNSDSLLQAAFDSDYNFPLYDGLKLASTVSGQADKLDELLSPKVPAGSYKMNFLDNHDKNTYDGTLEKRFGKEKIGALWSLIFTSEGVPLVYSGDEESLDLSLEFFEKDNIDFGDYEYKDMISKLGKIRTDNKALYSTTGGKIEYLKEDNDSVIAFSRKKGNNKITVVANLSNDEQTVKYDKLPDGGEVLMHGDSKGMDEKNDKVKGKDLKKLKAWEYYIIQS